MKVAYLILMMLVISDCGDLLSRYKIIGMKKPKLTQILSEVQSQIRSGGSIETSLSYLDTLKATIDDEQIRHDQLFTDQKNQCSLELDLRSKDIKDAEQVLNRAREQLETCSSSQAKTQTELENILSNQKTTDTDIQILAGIRDAGSQLYANKKQDHIDGLRSLQESLKILDGFQSGGASLAQVSEVSLRMIQNSVKLGVYEMMSPISGIFAQMLTENGGYLEVYEKLKQFLTSLEETLYKNLQKYQEEEDTSITEYDDRRVHLIEYYNNLKRTEGELRDHISAMSLCQDQQTAILESARGKKVTIIIIRNSQIFDSAQKMCNDFEAEYQKASDVRKNEIDLVDQVKSSIIERTSAYKAKPDSY